MRGLTDAERSVLADVAEPAECDGPPEPCASDGERALCQALTVQGRAAVVSRENDEWNWEEWQATDLGRLALRVCPVGEP